MNVDLKYVGAGPVSAQKENNLKYVGAEKRSSALRRHT